MNILFIKKLIIKTIIGVYKWEKFIKQKLIFDIHISIKNKQNDLEHNLKNYIDYTNIVEVVFNYVSNNKFDLLENLAEKVALLILNNFNINWVKIKILKPGVFLKGSKVGILIKRFNKNNV